MTDRHLDEAARHLLALGVLLALQYTSFGLHYIGFERYAVVALVIAGVMVVISALVFMDLRRSLPVTRLVAVIAVLFIALLCLGVAGDVAYR